MIREKDRALAPDLLVLLTCKSFNPVSSLPLGARFAGRSSSVRVLQLWLSICSLRVRLQHKFAQRLQFICMGILVLQSSPISFELV